jgi:hypothetical protein
MTAAGNKHGYYVITRRKILNAVSHCLYHTGGFVAQRHGYWPRPVAVDHGQVGMAQTSRSDLHQHLVVAGRIELQFLDDQGLGVLIGTMGANSL